jgi:hypothetical protein
MKLKTTHHYHAKPEELWPLLFGSKMDTKHPCNFLFGLPKPLECRLQDGEGGVGKMRECVSDKGIIKQTILEWEPNKKLSFELKETDIYFGPCVTRIIETFTINPITESTTSITRETKFVVISKMRLFISIPMFIGLKSIHFYVFKNWNRIIEASKAIV